MIKRALISLSDKTGILPFAKELQGMGVEILSTGGTAKLLRENGVVVKDVSEHTGFPEIMDGRVKTLHPRIHGGLLGLRDNPAHVEAAKKNKIEWIDMVVVNLYPFEAATAKKGVSREDAIENIDIGGPSMLRSAAKNFRHVVVITDSGDYQKVLDELKSNADVSENTRRELALKVFERTSAYDQAIASYFNQKFGNEQKLSLAFTGGQKLRYGENSHQEAVLYADAKCEESSLVQAEILHGKEMSFNNYVDGDAALEAVKELWESPGVAIVKHTNPCGFATGSVLGIAFVRAWEGDPVSAFGSVIAVTRPVDLKAAEFLKGKFIEALIAPDFSPEALEFLKNKSADIRLIKIRNFDPGKVEQWTYRKITGGMLAQSKDLTVWEKFKVVTKKAFNISHKDLAAFAVKACKHTKSNAIVLAREYERGFYQVMGMGAGQPNRIDSLRKLAITRARENLESEYKRLRPTKDEDDFIRDEIAEMVMASDAFFPFDDTIKAAGELGIRYIVQPGGSKKDEDSIKAADELGIAMAFTGTRHFCH